MAFGDIYVVAFDPSVGHEYKGKRPAIVIQEEEFSKNSCVTVMPMSSKLEKMTPADVFVEKDNKNRLTSNSMIRVGHIHTFDKSRFLGFIGNANSPVIRQVRGYLRRHFGL